MPERLKRTPLLCAVVVALICAAFPVRMSAQAGGGSIVGRVRIAPGNEIKSPVLVNLGTRGTTVNSVYTDNEGNFGFTGLPGNLYHIEINETGYLPVQEQVVIDPVTTTMRIVDIYLTPRDAKTKSSDPIKGGNTRLADSAQYAHEIQIPKPARKEFEKGVKLDRDGKSDEAIKRYQKAIEISPEFYEARNNLGSDLLGKSRFPEAQQQFEQVVKVNPSDAAAYFNLGNLCLLTQQLDKGQQWVQQGLSKQPDSAFGHFLSGSLYARNGRTGEAEIALKRSLELDPIMSKAHLALVNLYLQQKRSEDAAVELRAFLKAFPEDPFAPKARQVLQKLEGSDSELKPQ
jgi:tetratricopeptide (TPR) repeat protein